MSDKQSQGKISREIGYFHEKIAVAYLLCHGYLIVARNLLGKKGSGVSEIDIIAKKDNTLVFIEVKYRKDKSDTYYAISEKSKQRIINAASLFIANNKEYQDFEIRFDAILFSKGFSLEHIKTAFYA